MNIRLPKDVEEFLDELLKSGLYEHPDFAICDGLRLLKNQYDLYKVRLDELRALIAVGIAQADRGEVAPLDIDALLAKARQRLARDGDGNGSVCPTSSAPTEPSST